MSEPVATTTTATKEASMETDDHQEETREDEDVDRGGHRLVLPEDGYKWRKYGQKFIKNIGKFRSYFRCQRQNCSAKKRVEWCTSQPDNLRILYDGVHTHSASSTISDDSQGTSNSNSNSNSNQYNLLTQVFGDHQPTSSS